MIDQAISQFNVSARELAKNEFPIAKTPDEWKQIAADRRSRDHGKLVGPAVQFLNAFEALDLPMDRESVAARLNSEALHILRLFGHAAAILAVRRQEPALIRKGLLSLAVLGAVDDGRDLTFGLAELYHAARKVDVDTPAVFADVSCMADSQYLKAAIRSFPLREPKDRKLSAFGLRESNEGAEFDIVACF